MLGDWLGGVISVPSYEHLPLHIRVTGWQPSARVHKQLHGGVLSTKDSSQGSFPPMGLVP